MSSLLRLLNLPIATTKTTENGLPNAGDFSNFGVVYSIKEYVASQSNGKKGWRSLRHTAQSPAITIASTSACIPSSERVWDVEAGFVIGDNRRFTKVPETPKHHSWWSKPPAPPILCVQADIGKGASNASVGRVNKRELRGWDARRSCRDSTCSLRSCA